MGSGIPATRPACRFRTLSRSRAVRGRSITGRSSATVNRGTEFRYSGGGYQLLQLAVEDVTGRTLADLAHQLIFEPLGMDDSTYLEPKVVERASRAHDEGGVAGEHRCLRYPEHAAAGLWTTPLDLARFACELLNATCNRHPRVISPAIAAAMSTPLMGDGSYGLGLQVSNDRFGHGGGNWGFTSNLHGVPDERRGFVAMTNCWGMPTYETLPRIVDVVTGGD